jgi:hypothetical protein
MLLMGYLNSDWWRPSLLNAPLNGLPARAADESGSGLLSAAMKAPTP